MNIRLRIILSTTTLLFAMLVGCVDMPTRHCDCSRRTPTDPPDTTASPRQTDPRTAPTEPRQRE